MRSRPLPRADSSTRRARPFAHRHAVVAPLMTGLLAIYIAAHSPLRSILASRLGLVLNQEASSIMDRCGS